MEKLRRVVERDRAAHINITDTADRTGRTDTTPQAMADPTPPTMTVSVPALDQAVRRFRGEHSQEFTSYRQDLEVYWDTYPGFTEKQRIHHIFLTVSLDVRDRLELYTTETLQVAKLILDKMEEKFRDTRSVTQLVMELHSVKQGQQESMESFEQRLRRALRDLRSKQLKEHKPQMETTIMPGLFTEGLANHTLKIHLRQKLYTTPLTSIDDLIKLCRTLAPEPTEQKVLAAAANANSEVKELRDMVKELTLAVKSIQQQQQTHQQQPMYQTQPGPMYNNQPMYQSQPPQTYQSTQVQSRRSGLLPTPRECWSCKSTNHIQRDCHMRTGNDQRR